MKQTVLTIESNRPVTASVYRMDLRGTGLEEQRPGQFVNIRLAGHFLRRPISVYDWEGDRLTVLYKTVGHGTEQLSRMQSGETLDVLTGLGNGYDLGKAGETPLLLGGGVGVPPLYLLAKCLLAKGCIVRAVLGFNTREEVFGEKAFRALGCEVTVTTADGSYGMRGFVTDALPDTYSYFYTCGPEPMLRAVYRATNTSGQFSFEERMGCGFGACMGCSCKTVTGQKRICREGPVLEKEEILWAD
ncbi:MAG: dihydroorotate dehydrogenase electron transfer subunit [Clostridia bacterium]|nr:dihydroorotate dehydrogenase electron transfer subunit [Clostridia bacterium]